MVLRWGGGGCLEGGGAVVVSCGGGVGSGACLEGGGAVVVEGKVGHAAVEPVGAVEAAAPPRIALALHYVM